MSNNNQMRNKKRTGKFSSKRRESKDPRTSKLEEQEEHKDYNNHPSYYFKDKALMEQVTSLSFTQFLEADGTPFSQTEHFDKVKVPAICNLYFNPSPGFTLGRNTADGGINIAAMKLYTKLSSMNAKTTQYAPQDVAMLMLALGEVVSTYEWIRRVFRSAFLYNKRNWNMPKALITAMQVDFDDLISNLADYRLRFNAVVNSINQISFPGDLEYFSKCATMYSHIYQDSDSPMSQIYMFHPATTWILDETAFDEGSILKTTRFCQRADGSGFPSDYMQPLSYYIDLLSTMIQAILNSSTYNYIYADVLRLVDPSKLLTMPYIIEGDGIAPEFDPMMNVMINNLNIVPQPVGAGTETRTPANDVYPKVDNNAVFYAPLFPKNWGDGATTQTRILGETIINFPHSMGNPDVDQRVEATRFITLVEGDVESTDDAAIPDHYCVYLAVVTKLTEDGNGFNVDGTNVSYTSGSVGLLSYLTKFDYCPRIYMQSGPDNLLAFGDLDYFTTIREEYLKKVNDLAYVTLFTPDSILGLKA
nr:putative capsid protein [Picobirnavirus sp.]